MKTVIFLDMDGVLSNHYTHSVLRPKCDKSIVYFTGKCLGGEYISLDLAKVLSNTLKNTVSGGYYKSVDVVLISSCAIMWCNGHSKDRELGMGYWSEVLDLPFRGFIPYSGSSGKERYNNCLKYLDEHYKDVDYNAYVIDDMDIDHRLTGYIHVEYGTKHKSIDTCIRYFRRLLRHHLSKPGIRNPSL